MKIEIPEDVSVYVKKHFSGCNNQVARDLSLFPAIHEESLDMNFISYFSRHQVPVTLPSKWVVRIDAHFIGGGRHFGTWEVADIGLMMIFRRNGKVIRSKIALLQSKKLYANPLKYREESQYVRSFGLGRLLVPEETHRELIRKRLLAFKETSKYKAFKKGSEQQKAMGHFEGRWDTEMYYLFYNPKNIPHSVKMPMESVPKLGKNKVGCRVIPKSALDSALSGRDDGFVPSYKFIKESLPSQYAGNKACAGWRLEYFVTDLMLECKEGLIDDSPNYESLLILMNQKNFPMSCSMSITFDIDE